ncbi:MAG: hypothetical protein ACE5I1_08015 [bacterium]
MYAPQKQNLFIAAWRRTFQSLRSPKMLIPFLIYAGLQFLVLAGLVYFMHPPFSYIFLPLHKWFYGEAVLHYPNHFLVLPQLFDTINILLSGLIGVVTIGIATLMFFKNNEGRSRSFGTEIEMKPVASRYFHLLGAWFVQAALVLGYIFVFSTLAAKSPDFSMYIKIVRYIGATCLSAVFVFTTVHILIENDPFWTALANSARLFSKYALVTILLVGIPSLWQVPVQFLNSNTAAIVRRLNPEVIALVMTGGIIASMVASYFIIGTVTNLYRNVRH